MDLYRDMMPQAEAVTAFLKGLANPQRLLILCLLLEGERNVGELIAATGIAQTSMSQHLARLRAEGIVAVRRDHRALYYRIEEPLTRQVLDILHARFCGEGISRG